jgi:hypothetical protein
VRGLQHSEYYGAMRIVFPRFAGVPRVSYFPASKTLELEGLEMSMARVVDPHDVH